MATYKVPQDVEADDKLIGPFSFRQFIYLMVVAMAGGMAWGLSQIFVPLAIVPLPIIIFFGSLALPLRKDQPMEIYMAAMVSFYLKPRRRLWDPDGIDSLIEITAPKMVDVQLTKDLSQNEVKKRLGYLAQIVDTQGWAVRGPGVQAPNSAVNSDIYFEAQTAQDIMGSDNYTLKTFDDKLTKSDADRHQEMIDIMKGKTNNYFSNTPVAEPITAPDEPTVTQPLEYNPYPTDIQQSVIEPLSEDELVTKPTSPEPAPLPKPEPVVPTSENVVTTDIINLANNTDLSIETIAHEANRINKRQDMTEEVVISLR